MRSGTCKPLSSEAAAVMFRGSRNRRLCTSTVSCADSNVRPRANRLFKSQQLKNI